MRRTRVDFSCIVRPWDGFGVNYVEACQTRDHGSDPQEYGGFSVLSGAARKEVLDLTFGPDGLRPGLVKMFLNPFHQPPPRPHYSFGPDDLDLSAYDHATTRRWMRYSVREGLQRVRTTEHDRPLPRGGATPGTGAVRPMLDHKELCRVTIRRTPALSGQGMEHLEYPQHAVARAAAGGIRPQPGHP